MLKLKFKQTGFTLIEIAIVLIVVTILIGYTAALVPVQQEIRQYQTAESEMKSIVNQLVGYAQINGRLPCPDTSGNINGVAAGVIDGREDTDDIVDNVTLAVATDGITDNCKAFFGFVPGRTLGLLGNYDSQGRILDPWGQPYRYAVSDIDTAGTSALIDLVTPNNIRAEGLAAVAPDLILCDGSPTLGNQTSCSAPAATIVDGVAAVVVSTGKDRNDIASNIQVENTDNFHDGTGDKVYIASTRSDANNAEYDDVVVWLSTPRLFSKMIEAGQLP